MIRFFLKLIKKAVSQGLIHLFSANYLTQMLAFGSLLFVSKMLSPEELGAIKIIQSYVAVCVTFAILGKSNAIIKFCAETKDLTQRENMLKHSVVSSLIASVIIIGILNVMTFMGVLSQDYIVNRWIPWYSLAILFSAFYTICITYLQACKDFKLMATIQSGVKLVSAFFVITATYAYGLLGYITAILLMLMISVVPLLHRIGMKFLFQKRKPLPQGFTFLANVGIVSSIIGTFSMYIDMFFLNHFVADRAMIGFYALATILIMVETQFVGTVQTFLTPFFSERSYDGRWLWQETKRYQRYLVCGVIFVCCGIYMLGMALVHFYYGLAYEMTLLFLGILLCRALFQSGYAIFGIALQSINKEQYNCLVAVFNLTLRCGLSYVLLHFYGVLGLAIAQALTEVVIIVIEYMVAYRVFRRHFGTDVITSN